MKDELWKELVPDQSDIKVGRMGLRLLFFMVVVILSMWFEASFLNQVLAKEPPEGWGTKQGEDIPILDELQEKRLDELQAEASAALLDVANWIDSFFDDARAVDEENTNRATIGIALGYSRNDNFDIKPRFDWRVSLPKLSNRTQFYISASDDEDFSVQSDLNEIRSADEKSDDSQVRAGLKWFLKESGKYNISLDTGVSWEYLFAGLRYRSLQTLGEWQGRLTNRLRYYTDDGFENKLSYDLERTVTDKTMFRTTTSVNWYEEKEGFPHSQYFRLYQVFSEYQALSYESGVFLTTDPSYKMTDLQFTLKYRQRFFRDWLVLEIVPRVTFPEEQDYNINPGIIFNFKASIGYRANEAGYGKIFH